MVVVHARSCLSPSSSSWNDEQENRCVDALHVIVFQIFPFEYMLLMKLQVSEMFDLIMGTSTGGILTACFGLELYSAEKVMKTFKELSKDV